MQKVQLIVADIRLLQEEETLLPEILPYYVRKYKDHKFPKEAKQELVTGLILKRYLGVTKEEQITYNEHGKPYLSSGKPFFNVSHSGNYVVVAIADCEVGVDAERIRKCHEATVHKVFREEQKQELERQEASKKDETFSRLWTECEAVLKLKGTGFGKEWKTGLKETYAIWTMFWDEVFITCATEEKAAIEIKHLDKSDFRKYD